MQRYTASLVLVCLLACSTGATSPAGETDQRFTLETVKVNVSAQPSVGPPFQTIEVLLKLDSATGEIWRYCQHLSDPKGNGPALISFEALVSVPVQDLATVEQPEAGRFRLVQETKEARTSHLGADGVARFLGVDKLFLLDMKTGRMWIHRGNVEKGPGRWRITDAFKSLNTVSEEP